MEVVNQYLNNVKTVALIAGGLSANLFGADSSIMGYFRWLIILMIFDFITGSLYAMAQGQLNSNEARKGFLKKIVNLMFISFCYLADKHTGTHIEIISIGAFIFGEGYSVMENFIKLGVPVPDKIKSIFLVSKESETIGK